MKKAALSLLDCFKYQVVYVNDRRKLKHSAPPVSELRPGIAEYGYQGSYVIFQESVGLERLAT